MPRLRRSASAPGPICCSRPCSIAKARYPTRGSKRAAEEDPLPDALANFIGRWREHIPRIQPVVRLLSAASLTDAAASVAWEAACMGLLRAHALALSKRLAQAGMLQLGWTAPRAADWFGTGPISMAGATSSLSGTGARRRMRGSLRIPCNTISCVRAHGRTGATPLPIWSWPNQHAGTGSSSPLGNDQRARDAHAPCVGTTLSRTCEERRYDEPHSSMPTARRNGSHPHDGCVRRRSPGRSSRGGRWPNRPR